MKVLCVYTAAGPSWVRNGWARVFQACGHTFRFWDAAQQSCHDAFSEYEPDLFIGTTYDFGRPELKCVKARPNMKVILFASANGPYLKDVDLKKFPLVVTSDEEKRRMAQLKKETGKPDFVFIHSSGRWLDGTMSGWKELGIPYHGILNACDAHLFLGGKVRPELVCDWGYVGNRWEYKSVNQNPYLLPLCHPDLALRGKIFGSGGWDGVSQWLGTISDEDQRDLFVSAKVCPNVSEPHSTTFGFDVVERPFKVLGAGGFCVSDYVDEARDLFAENELLMCRTPHEFHETVKHFVRHPDERIPYIRDGQRAVLNEHTYHHRVSQMLAALGMEKEAKGSMDAYRKHLKQIMPNFVLEENVNGTN